MLTRPGPRNSRLAASRMTAARPSVETPETISVSIVSRVLRGSHGVKPDRCHNPVGGCVQPREGSSTREDTMKTIEIEDSFLAYREAGAGDTTIVFLHGNPTSSH